MTFQWRRRAVTHVKAASVTTRLTAAEYFHIFHIWLLLHSTASPSFFFFSSSTFTLPYLVCPPLSVSCQIKLKLIISTNVEPDRTDEVSKQITLFVVRHQIKVFLQETGSFLSFVGDISFICALQLSRHVVTLPLLSDCVLTSML